MNEVTKRIDPLFRGFPELYQISSRKNAVIDDINKMYYIAHYSSNLVAKSFDEVSAKEHDKTFRKALSLYLRMCYGIDASGIILLETTMDQEYGWNTHIHNIDTKSIYAICVSIDSELPSSELEPSAETRYRFFINPSSWAVLAYWVKLQTNSIQEYMDFEIIHSIKNAKRNELIVIFKKYDYITRNEDYSVVLKKYDDLISVIDEFKSSEQYKSYDPWLIH